MAGQYIALQDIKRALAYRGDLENMLERHPDVNLEQEINLSWRILRQKLANAGVNVVLQATAIASLPTTEVTLGCGYAELPWPTDAVSIHGLDVKAGGSWLTVPQGAFAQRRLGAFNSDRGDYQYADAGQCMWIVRSLPTVSAAAGAAGAIMLFPVPTGGQYVLWYLPEWVDITLDTNVFPGQEGWSDWVIWDMVVKMLIRDTGPQASAQLQSATAERERIWGMIRTNTQKTASATLIQPHSRYGSWRRGARMIP